MDESAKESEGHTFNYFIVKGPFEEGQRINAGFGTLFTVDYTLTYSRSQFEPLRQASITNRKRIKESPTSNDLISFDQLKVRSDLTEEEISDILAAWKAVIDFNGGELFHEQDKTKERVKMYHNADIRGTTIGIENFKDKQMMECTEIAAICHDLFSANEQYESIFIQGVTYPSPDRAEGHNFVIVRNRNSSKYFLLDMAFHSKIKRTDAESTVIRVPFYSVLNEMQIEALQKGLNIECSFGEDTHTYRIGTPYTPEGSYKSKF